MLHVDHAAAAEQQRALDDVAELANVARPAVSAQHRIRLGRDATGEWNAVAVDGMTQERVHEIWNLRDTFAQRRNHERDAVESKVEILAKLASFDLGLEIAVGGTDESYVDVARLERADAEHLPLFKYAQELHLDRHRQLADLIEEHGASVGSLEQARLGLYRAGERALLVAKQLALEQRLRK